jgi:hypothetical protein
MRQFFGALAVVLFSSLLALAGDEPKDKKPARDQGGKRLEEWKKLSPEDRAAKREELKARLEKRVVELRGKQDKKTITEQEQRELTRSEQILKRFETMESKDLPLLRGGRTNTPAAPPPPEK